MRAIHLIPTRISRAAAENSYAVVDRLAGPKRRPDVLGGGPDQPVVAVLLDHVRAAQTVTPHSASSCGAISATSRDSVGSISVMSSPSASTRRAIRRNTSVATPPADGDQKGFPRDPVVFESSSGLAIRRTGRLFGDRWATTLVAWSSTTY